MTQCACHRMVTGTSSHPRTSWMRTANSLCDLNRTSAIPACVMKSQKNSAKGSSLVLMLPKFVKLVAMLESSRPNCTKVLQTVQIVTSKGRGKVQAKQMLVVRTGKGSVGNVPAVYDPKHNPMTEFTDSVEIVERVPRQHSAWQAVFYKGQRYQLFGGIHTFWFICLDHPLKRN